MEYRILIKRLGQQVSEVFIQQDDKHPLNSREIVQTAVQKSGLKSSRQIPQTVVVEVYSQRIEKGEIVNTLQCSREQALPYGPLTRLEFEDEMGKILAQFPSEFQEYVRSQSWNRGHSAGYEEVITYAEGFIDELLPCIKLFEENSQV